MNLTVFYLKNSYLMHNMLYVKLSVYFELVLLSFCFEYFLLYMVTLIYPALYSSCDFHVLSAENLLNKNGVFMNKVMLSVGNCFVHTLVCKMCSSEAKYCRKVAKNPNVFSHVCHIQCCVIQSA